MKGGASANPGKHEPVKSLSQLHLFVTTTFARKKKSYFREFQPEKQLSFSPPLLFLPSATGRIIFPRDFGPRTITRPLENPPRKSFLCFGDRQRHKATRGKSSFFPGHDARLNFWSKADAHCFTGFHGFSKLEIP